MDYDLQKRIAQAIHDAYCRRHDKPPSELFKCVPEHRNNMLAYAKAAMRVIEITPAI